MIAEKGPALFCCQILHLFNTSSARVAAFARSQARKPLIDLEMVVGLPWFSSERPNKDRAAERRCNCPVFFDGSRIAKKSISDAVYVSGGAPGMNTLRAA